MKWLAIANPAAGRARDAQRALSHLGKSAGLKHEVAHTGGPGDATRLARLAAEFDGLIAVGGDGTIGEILHGMDLARQRLAVMPAGHGNCLARDLGVGDAQRAVVSLQRNACRQVDLMDVRIGFADGHQEQRLCASTLAVGYVTQVVQLGRHRLPGLGRAAYAAAAMLVIPVRFDAHLGPANAKAVQRLTGVVINNTAHLANFKGFPAASTHDGLLDIMEQNYAWPRQLLHNLSVLLGSPSFGPACMRQATVEQLVLEQPRTLMADGELLHDVTSLSVSCRPAALNAVVGAA
jgi:diacylglycerol kinase (ATP)